MVLPPIEDFLRIHARPTPYVEDPGLRMTQTSLKANILSTYASQAYVSLIGIVMLPLYLRYMGHEGYGLVGFFAMFQAWFQLLDVGLSPTLARQMARYRGGALDILDLRRLLRAMEGVFVGVAVAAALCIVAGAGSIATRWLNVESLPLQDVRASLMLMAVVIALRWISGLYRSALSGLEQLVWLSGWNSVIATLRFVAVIALFVFVSTSPVCFFAYQLGVAILELAVLAFRLYGTLPVRASGQKIRWELRPLKGVLSFSISIAFTSSVWVIMTQTDKLLMSRLLPLADYGAFTLAVLVASGVMMVSSPISSAIVPRMTRMQAANDEARMLKLYRGSTQLVMTLTVPPALILALFAKPVLWAWTGDIDLAEQAAPVLTLYALGNGVMSAAAFQHYLQFAKGELTLHVIGSAVFVVVLVPALIVMTSVLGMEGAGWVWLILNLAFLVLWVPIVHRRYAPGLHLPWLLRDVAAPAVIAISVAVVMQHLIGWRDTPWIEGRLSVSVQLVAMTLVLVLVSSLGSDRVRAYAVRCWSR